MTLEAVAGGWEAALEATEAALGATLLGVLTPVVAEVAACDLSSFPVGGSTFLE